MDVTDPSNSSKEISRRMVAATDHVRRELAGIRTGRASITILDSVQVEMYGSHLPLNQCASLSVPEPTLIVANPFDTSQITAVEKAIRNANLGLKPQQRRQGRPCPDPSTDRRAAQGAVQAGPQAGGGGTQQCA